jgi:hypothetical protein
MVPFGGTWVSPSEQARALFIEHAKADYHEAEPRGLRQATLRLAATDTLPAEEVILTPRRTTLISSPIARFNILYSCPGRALWHPLPAL